MDARSIHSVFIKKPLCYIFSPWLQSAAFALLVFASTTVDSSLMINLKIFTSKGMLVHLSGSVEEEETELNINNMHCFMVYILIPL